MKQYLDALQNILSNGVKTTDRTGTGTISVFGQQMVFDLQQGFPAVTTKTLAWKAVVGELLWFLEGSTDERRLAEITYGKPRHELVNKRTIWTDNANNQGVALGYYNDALVKELGPIYGTQWRNFNNQHVDQIQQVIDLLKTFPDSRRAIISAWNPVQINAMALPPCHTLVQFRLLDNKLSCQLYQRSADMFLGVPFNIASYSLLTHMIAQELGVEVGNYVHTIGDAHVYLNHLEAVTEQLTRQPSKLPTLKIPALPNLSVETIKQTAVTDFALVGYNPQPTIKAIMAV